LFNAANDGTVPLLEQWRIHQDFSHRLAAAFREDLLDVQPTRTVGIELGFISRARQR